MAKPERQVDETLLCWIWQLLSDSDVEDLFSRAGLTTEAVFTCVKLRLRKCCLGLQSID